MLILLQIFQFLAGFVFLVAGAEFLVRGASRLAARFNVPPVVIGLTIVAFGTSLPELMVSLTANMDGDGGGIVMGNIVGSNIANLGLILGLSALVAALPVGAQFPRRELPGLFGITVVLVLFALLGERIDRIEGALLVVGLLVFIYLSYRATVTEQAYQAEVRETLAAAEAIDEQIARPSSQPWFDALTILMGLAGLIVGANLLVDAAETIARLLGISELIIGLTLVAIGTSLPEVATSLVAVFRGNGDIAIGNIVGSNLFNILGIVGITAIVSPIAVPSGMEIDFAVMLAFTALVWFLAWRRPHLISRIEGGFLLAGYLLYCVLLFTRLA
jgi:cation:H+ antiporter